MENGLPSRRRRTRMARKATKCMSIEPHKEVVRYGRRKARKSADSQDDVSKSLNQDWGRKARIVTKKRQGDRGDAKPQETPAIKKKISKASG